MSEDIETQALTVVQQAKGIRIVDSQSYVVAGETWQRLAVMEKEAHAALDPVVEKAHSAHKEAVALRTRVLQPITEGKTHIKQIMSNYDYEQERIRVAEQARLQKMADEAEAARRAAELKVLEDQRKAEEARLLEEARKAEAEGNKAKAEAILEVGVKQVEELKAEEKAVALEPVVPQTVILQKEVPKVQGLSYRTIWNADLTQANIRAIAQAIGEGKLDTQAIDLNPSYWRKQAESRMETANLDWANYGVKAVSRRV
jgi:hypothetical protein